MTSEHNFNEDPRSRGVSRRYFLKLLTAMGFLAGCSPRGQLTPTATGASTDAPLPSNTPSPAHTPAPIETPTVTPLDEPSTVVHTRHAGVWGGADKAHPEELAPAAISQMLDASITELTGLNDATGAWASLFSPEERIAIKVNTINSSNFWTRAPLVMAVTERLQEVGVPAEQIVIFDRRNNELENAGYTVNVDGPGVRCYGTDGSYTEGWTVLDTDIGISDILLNCDALINMPILKQHNHSGITFAMKNHFGTFDKPRYFHRPKTGPAIVELNALPPIWERARLVVGDALTVCTHCPGAWLEAVTGDSILMSTDPVAHDTIGLQVLAEAMDSDGRDPLSATELADPWLAESTKLGLGANDPDYIDLIEIDLG